jgi:hypothetical protein
MATSPNGHAELVVVGGGPGGYPAAFAAADHGLDVVLVNEEAELGGVCLLRGCFPSKALLHVAKLLSEAREAKQWGVSFGRTDVNLDALRQWKSQVVQRLTRGTSTPIRRCPRPSWNRPRSFWGSLLTGIARKDDRRSSQDVLHRACLLDWALRRTDRRRAPVRH